MMGVGFIGAGYIVSTHCQEMAKHPGTFRVAGFYDLVSEKAENRTAEFGGRPFSALAEMLDSDEVDMCVVATKPHSTHAPLAIRALHAGKHCVVEKPFCITVEEADAMIAAARTAGKTLTCHQNRRWDLDYLAIKEIYEKQLVGKPRFLVIERGGPVGPSDVLYNWGSHGIDQILALKREAPVRVRGFLVFPQNKWDELGGLKALLTFADGFVAEVVLMPRHTEWGDQQRVSFPLWQIVGESGCLYQFSRQREEDVWLMAQGFSGLGEDYPWYQPDFLEVRSKVPDFYALLAEYFHRGGPVPVKDTEARLTCRVMEAIQHSARENREVEMEEE